jgi:hypothetical protein
MDKEKLLQVTSIGGKTAHAMGKAHEWTKVEASKAGKTGGKVLKGSKWSRLRYLMEIFQAGCFCLRALLLRGCGFSATAKCPSSPQ